MSRRPAREESGDARFGVVPSRHALLAGLFPRGLLVEASDGYAFVRNLRASLSGGPLSRTGARS